MKRLFRHHTRAAVMWLVLLTLAAWFGPSFLSAERYRRQLESALERRLMRPVAFGSVSYRLLPHPGFSIYSVVVKEDPRFGAEPFARVERIDCDLRWRSLWGSRLDFAQLHLQAPTFNVVRGPGGEWNLESLLRQVGIASPRKTSPAEAPRQGDIDLDARDARLNFKFGANKKPFAIMDLAASVSVVGGRRIRFRMAGSPVRTDVALTSPGRLELSGEWTPGENLDGPLEATLRTRRSLLYNWLPLLTGRNPEIYGVLDFDTRLTGSLRTLRIEGQGSLNRVHRWESLPPSDSMTISLAVRGRFDRALGKVEFEGLDASFANSRLHLTGSVDKIPASPDVDLVIALERSRVEDVLALGHRLSGLSSELGASGRVDGLLTIQGSWSALRFGGFMGARDVALHVSAGTFPVSDLSVKIGEREATLEPAQVTLTPRVELGIEGALRSARPVGRERRPTGPPVYELLVTTKAAPIRDLVRFARGLGVRAAQDLDAEGTLSSTLRLVGTAWPLASPVPLGSFELHGARLLLPGFAEPINLSQARIQVNGDHIVADPLLAVIGDSAFSGRLEHRGERSRPWTFNLRASTLSLEESSRWFGAERRRRGFPLLESIPGFASLTEGRTAGATLLGGLSAEGSFSTAAVVYRSATLTDLRSAVELSGWTIRLSNVSFRAAGGRGQGSLQVNLGESPPFVTGETSLDSAKLQAVALPAPLRTVRGLFSGSGQFQTRGSTREELARNLQGEAMVRLRSVSGFDPVAVTARAVSWGELEPGHVEPVVRSATLAMQIRDRRLILSPVSVEIGGALLRLDGGCGFDGTVDLGVRADFRQLTRRWLDDPGDTSPAERVSSFRLTGPLDRLVVLPEVQASRARPLPER